MAQGMWPPYPQIPHARIKGWYITRVHSNSGFTYHIFLILSICFWCLYPDWSFFLFIRHLKCLEDIFRVEIRGRDYKREWTMDQTENRQRMHVIILMSLFSVYLVFVVVIVGQQIGVPRDFAMFQDFSISTPSSPCIPSSAPSFLDPTAARNVDKGKHLKTDIEPG